MDLLESEILAVISGNGKRFKYINLYIWSVGLCQYWQIQLHSYLWRHQIVSFNSRLVEKYLVFKCLSIIYSLVYDLIKKKEKKINTQVTSSVGKERKRYSHFLCLRFTRQIWKIDLNCWSLCWHIDDWEAEFRWVIQGSSFDLHF